MNFDVCMSALAIVAGVVLMISVAILGCITQEVPRPRDAGWALVIFGAAQGAGIVVLYASSTDLFELVGRPWLGYAVFVTAIGALTMLTYDDSPEGVRRSELLWFVIKYLAQRLPH